MLALFLLFATVALASVLENNPFHNRALFKAEFKVREIVEDMSDYMDPQDSLSNEIQWFFFSHDAVLRTLEMHGVNGFADLERMGKEGDNLVDDHLAGNILHIFAMVRRCIHFVDKMVANLEERQEQRKRQLEEAKTCIIAEEEAAIDTCREERASKLDQENEESDDPFSNGEYLNKLIEVRKSTFWPDEDDLKLTALSLARIQYVYQLPAGDLLQGKIGSRSTPVKMFADDAQFIAEERLSRRHPLVPTSNMPEYGIAIEWLEAGYNLSVAWYGEDNDYTAFIKKHLIDIREKHDDVHSPLKPGDEPSLVPNEIHLIRQIGTDLSVTARSLRLEEYEEFQRRNAGVAHDDGHTYSRRDFFALCRGEKIKIAGTQSPYHQCHLETRGNPYLFLQPLKTEVVGTEPLMAKVYHDVFTEDQVELLKEIMIQKGSLASAKVFNQKNPGDGDNVSTDRTQTTGWLFEGDYPELIPLSKRLDYVSGLQVSFEKDRKDYYRFIESEDFQIGVYSPGGLYLCHKDSLTHDSVKWHNTTEASTWVGDRIATLMLYLSDVDGGRTAFPHVGAFATPSKGAAVFWFNMGDDGTEDRNSLHGGCPVLYGTKWVSNKWIREGAQVFKRPCNVEKWEQTSIAEKLPFIP